MEMCICSFCRQRRWVYANYGDVAVCSPECDRRLRKLQEREVVDAGASPCPQGELFDVDFRVLLDGV